MPEPEPQVTEIAPDIYRISGFVSEFNLQFNHFLVKDEEPLLFHTGLKAMFPLVREGVRKVMDPAEIRWISARASLAGPQRGAQRDFRGTLNSPSSPPR